MAALWQHYGSTMAALWQHYGSAKAVLRQYYRKGSRTNGPLGVAGRVDGEAIGLDPGHLGLERSGRVRPKGPAALQHPEQHLQHGAARSVVRAAVLEQSPGTPSSN